MLKKILLKLFYFLCWVIFRPLALSYRYQYSGLDNLLKAKSFAENGNFIYAVWHQRYFALAACPVHYHAHAIVSRSKDGDFAEQLGNIFHYRAIRGSSSRGGKEAKQKLIEALMNSTLPGAITVDGPRGPSFEVKYGIIEIAQKAKVPIVPLNCEIESYWSFKSWDKFRLPKPFSGIKVLYGEPIMIDQSLGSDEYPHLAGKLAQKLKALCL